MPNREAEQSLAADGAIAYFSSNPFPISLNADRAPQLKASIGRYRDDESNQSRNSNFANCLGGSCVCTDRCCRMEAL